MVPVRKGTLAPPEVMTVRFAASANSTRACSVLEYATRPPANIWRQVKGATRTRLVRQRLPHRVCQGRPRSQRAPRNGCGGAWRRRMDYGGRLACGKAAPAGAGRHGLRDHRGRDGGVQVIVWRDLFAKRRRELGSQVVEVTGRVWRWDGTTNVIATDRQHVDDASSTAHGVTPLSLRL